MSFLRVYAIQKDYNCAIYPYQESPIFFLIIETYS